MYHFDVTDLLLCMQDEMCREIRPNVRAVQADLNEEKKEIHAWFYFDGEISSDDDETASYIYGQATNDSDDDFQGVYHCIRLDYPKLIPINGYWVYLRDESILPYGSVVTDLRKMEKNRFIETLSHQFARLELHIQNALLGRVRPNLRAVYADIDEWKKILYFWFYFEGAISQQDKAIAWHIMQETKVHFGSEYTVKESVRRYDYPGLFPNIGIPMYVRDEKILAPKEDDSWEMPPTNRMNLLLGMLQSLQGKVTPNLRAVKVSLNQCSKTSRIWFFFDKKISEEERRLAKEGMGCYPGDYARELFVERIDFPTSLPHVGHYAYLRYEPVSENSYTDESSFNLLKSTALAYLKEAEIPAHLKSVKIDIHEVDKIIYFWFYFQGNITEENYSFARHIMQKTVAHFDSLYTIEENIHVLPSSKEIPDEGCLIYPYLDFHKNEEELYELKGWGEMSRPIFSLLLHTQRALLGKVGRSLRAVKVALDQLEKRWYIWLYYDGEIQKEDEILVRELIISISSQLHYEAEAYLECLDHLHPIPHIGHYAYLRHEPKQ